MLFTWDITVTAGTPDASPKTQSLSLITGILTDIEVHFPDGPNGTVKVQFLESGSVIAPSGANQYITGNDEVVTAVLNRKLPETSPTLTFSASSPTATYDHVITVRINIDTPAVLVDITDLVTQIAKALDTEFTPPPPAPITPPATTKPIMGA